MLKLVSLHRFTFNMELTVVYIASKHVRKEVDFNQRGRVKKVAKNRRAKLELLPPPPPRPPSFHSDFLWIFFACKKLLHAHCRDSCCTKRNLIDKYDEQHVITFKIKQSHPSSSSSASSWYVYLSIPIIYLKAYKCALLFAYTSSLPFHVCLKVSPSYILFFCYRSATFCIYSSPLGHHQPFRTKVDNIHKQTFCVLIQKLVDTMKIFM